MNTVAILPKLCMRLLQTQNVKRQIAQTVEPTNSDLAASTQEDTQTEPDGNDKKEN